MLGGSKMATAELATRQPRPDHLSGIGRAGVIDRWIYVFMAASFVVFTLVGFIPDAMGKVAAVEAGQRPPFPLALHLHAILMGTFLMLLLSQTVLMATGRDGPHRKLGIAGVVVGAALVVVGVILVPTMYHQLWDSAQAAPPPVREQLMTQAIPGFDNIILLQMRIGIAFPLALFIAVRARGTNPGLHKRLMILATAVALPAAFDRMTFLPNSQPGSPISADLYTLAALSPLFIWDVVRNKSVHRAYWIFLGIFLPLTVAVYALWNTPWWHDTVHRMMGV
jgi:hypothetical protein